MQPGGCKIAPAFLFCVMQKNDYEKNMHEKT